MFTRIRRAVRRHWAPGLRVAVVALGGGWGVTYAISESAVSPAGTTVDVAPGESVAWFETSGGGSVERSMRFRT